MKKLFFLILSVIVLIGCASRQTITLTSKLVSVQDQQWCIVDPFISFPVLGVWEGAEGALGMRPQGEIHPPP
ncbi:hypothetical protein [Desulfovibrio ferrophilus]|uniref:TonB-linked outer membrane protein, SusC/RagA family n=1 Tax=Desulfovibrio ferrophilus TaxID=241368 RepID=A0A2Z6AWT8_9BACT|nr:hypothetical protein [Desulfovibrio ferrophilus]BBD07675.1 TonB-linked outer membrane protein, SusC/RagA family [Desulfovibrio ferrophilus]